MRRHPVFIMSERMRMSYCNTVNYMDMTEKGIAPEESQEQQQKKPL
jgi:hypothetical protein